MAKKKAPSVSTMRLLVLTLIAIGVVAGFTYYFLTNVLTNSKAASPYNTIAKKNACYEKAVGYTHNYKLCTTFASVKVKGVWSYPSGDTGCKAAYDWCFFGKGPGSGGRSIINANQFGACPGGYTYEYECKPDGSDCRKTGRCQN